MKVGLAYTQMKLGRAYEHLGQLKVEQSTFLKSKAYIERRYDDPQRSLHIINIQQSITPDPIGLLVGEFAHCIRSGFDNLAWQLALLTTDKPGRSTAFPIESQRPGP